MAIVTVAELIEQLRRYRLLSATQMDETAGGLRERFATPLALARELIGRGWLTPYQVNQLFLGRGGELLLGSYVLLERLGEGGMGQVFKARNWRLDRVVALKLIRKDRLASPAAVKRFEREIRLVAQLDHPHIVRAVDADAVDGTYLFAMELVAGTDLSRHVAQHGPLPVARASDYVRQAALGLQHAYERGLVHRDVKPSNLLLAAAGDTVKLLDLGLARDSGADDEGSTALTQDGLIMGTPDYLAPEQALDAHGADIRADLYSLGCTFYFLLSGRPPFPGGRPLEKLIRHREVEAAPLADLRPDVPPAVVEVIRKLMAKRPADRYQTPAALAEALADLRADLAAGAAADTQLGVTAGPPPPAPVAWSAIVPTPTSDPLGGSSWLKRLKRPPRRWGWPAAGAAVAVLAVAALCWYLSGDPAATEPQDPQLVRPPRIQRVFKAPPRLAVGTVGLRLRVALPAHAGGVTALAHASGTELLATAGDDPEARVKLWDAVAGKPLRALTRPEQAPLALALVHDGTLLALAGRGGLVHLVDPATGTARPPLSVAAAEVRGLALTVDATTLAWGGRGAGGAGVLGVRDLDKARDLAGFDGEPGAALALQFVPSGKYLAGAWSDGKVTLFDLAKRRLLWTQVFDGPCPCLAISPGGHVLAAACPATDGPGLNVRLWSVPGGAPRGTLPVGAAITALAFSPDGTALAVACADGTIRLWDWDDVRLLAVRPTHPGPVRGLAFAPDGLTLATGGDDGMLRLWDVRVTPATPPAADRPPLRNSLGMELRPVPEGEFAMGRGAAPPTGPRHQVHIRRPYFLATREVTVGQFRAFVRATGAKVEPLPDGSDWQHPGWEPSEDHPVTGVSHADAVAFCAWLSEREGRTYRLPTEAEWEHAAAADLGDGPAPTGERANSLAAGLGKPVPVGCYAAGTLGLRDLAGNVAEWCADWYAAAYYKDSPPDDPTGPAAAPADGKHVVRGGDFSAAAAACTPAHREGRAGRHRTVGFRVVMEPSKEDLMPWQPLWTGHDLDQWEVKKGKDDDWALAAGRLVCKPGDKGWISTKRRYADFVLALEWRIPVQGDSGVVLRVPAVTGNPSTTGIEVQIKDGQSVKLTPTQECGAVVYIAPPRVPMFRGPGEWHRYEITCRGDHLWVRFDGVPVHDGAALLTTRASAGWLGLQSWETAVEFRNARVKVLKEAAPPADVPRLKPAATLAGHTKSVWRVALTADGKTAVSASIDKTAIVWDVPARKPRYILKHDRPVTAVAMTRDGARIVTGGKDLVQLWDGANGKLQRALPGHTGSISVLALAPDGRTLAGGGGDDEKRPEDLGVYLWDLAAGGPPRRLTAVYLSLVSQLGFSADGRFLAVAPRHNWLLYVWDLPGGGPAKALGGYKTGVRGLAFAADGPGLATASYDGVVRLWDAAAGKRTAIYPLRRGELCCVRFAPDDKTLAVADASGQIQLLDAATGAVRAVLSGHDGQVGDLAFSADGATLVSCGEDRTVLVWDVAAYCGR